jgi:DNA polymerase III subunit epsilon
LQLLIHEARPKKITVEPPRTKKAHTAEAKPTTTMMMFRPWAFPTTFRNVVTRRRRRRRFISSISSNNLVVHDSNSGGHGTENEAVLPMIEPPRRRQRSGAAVALIFDTETTGTTNWKEPYTHHSQPDLVQLGILLVDTETWQTKLQLSLLIRPSSNTQEIQPGAQAVHGISRQDGEKYGVPLNTALSVLLDAATQADCVVAHNLKFDRAVIQTALFRNSALLPPQKGGNDAPSSAAWSTDMVNICTMEYCTDLLRLPSQYNHTKSYKWPTLAESYQYFTNGQEIETAHDALADATACLTIFRGLLERQVIPPIPLKRRNDDDDDLVPPPMMMEDRTLAVVTVVPEAVEPPAMTTTSSSSSSLLLDAVVTPDAKLLWLEEKKIVRGNDLILQMTPHNTILVTGNTYRYKDTFKSWGATWDGAKKAWTMNNHDKLPALHRLVLATSTTTVPLDPKTPAAASTEHSSTSTTQRAPE